MFICREKCPSDKICDDYLENKFKQFETILKSMQLEVCEERPDCCHVLEERNEWIISLDIIKKTKEYNDFINYSTNNSINEELVNYAKYQFNL